MNYGQTFRNPPRGYVPAAPIVDRALIPPRPKRVRASRTATAVEPPAPVVVEPAPVLTITNDRLIMRQVVEHVAKITGVEVSVLIGGCRFGHVATARHYAYHLCRKRGNYSYPRIAGFFGRHHKTVLSGCRSIEVMVEVTSSDGELEAKIIEKVRYQRELFMRDLPKAAKA